MTMQTFAVTVFSFGALLAIGVFFWILYDSIKNDVPKYLSVPTLLALAIKATADVTVAVLLLNGGM